MRIVCLSDTHSLTDFISVPDGDILVVAGDICGHSNLGDISHFREFIGRQPHRYKVLIAGNHDRPFERFPDAPDIKHLKNEVIYLQDSGCEIGGLKFWGSPWQPEFYDWAFNLPRGVALAEKWALIPSDTDVLITHGPPYGILDVAPEGYSVGCEDLLMELHRVAPRLHVFGHIHGGYGVLEKGGTIFANASICTERYAPTNKPIAIDLK